MTGTELVVGYVEQNAGDRAVHAAADLAGRLGARLRIVHIITADDYPVDPDTEYFETEAARHLAERNAHVDAELEGSGLEWSQENHHGDPVTVLTHAAQEHDAELIVVGSRGEGFWSSLSRLLEPSVSHGLIGRQPRPVLVIPPDQHS